MADEPQPSTFTGRELLFNLTVSDSGRFEEVDGGLLVRDVPLLAAGTWTDSMKGTPLEYSPDVLSRNAANWLDTAIWSRHVGGVPRRITEKIGEVRNPRFMPAVTAGNETVENAVVGDVFLHQLSQDSRDTAAMVRAGQAPYVSVEHGGDEKWNVGKRRYELQSLHFTGAAIVQRGACAKCRINEAPPSDPDETGPETDMDIEDFEKRIAALETAHAEKVRELETTVADLATKIKELSEAEPPRELADFEARIAKLEETPAPQTGGDDETPRALTAPEGLVVRSGEIYREY